MGELKSCKLFSKANFKLKKNIFPVASKKWYVE